MPTNLFAAPDEYPLGAKVRLTTNDQKVVEATVVPPGGGAAGVTSFNGRAGVVVPLTSDYNSNQVDNVSATVPGASVSNALDFLRGLIASLVTGVSSFAGRSGAVTPQSGDYSSTMVTNSSGVAGATVTAALNALAASIAALVTGVSSFAGRGGAVVPVAGDYNSSQVNNTSGVVGATVTDALNALAAATQWSASWGAVAAPATPANRFFLRSAGVVGGANDNASFYPCPIAGTFPVTLTFACITALAVDSVQVAGRRNGVDIPGLTFTIAAGATFATITTPLVVAKGDRFAVRLLQSASEVGAAWNGAASIVVGAA